MVARTPSRNCPVLIERLADDRTDRDRIRALAREGFKLPVEDADKGAGEPILHSSRFVLVDAEGTIRGWYDSEDAGKRALLVKDARHLAADAASRR